MNRACNSPIKFNDIKKISHKLKNEPESSFVIICNTEKDFIKENTQHAKKSIRFSWPEYTGLLLLNFLPTERHISNIQINDRLVVTCRYPVQKHPPEVFYKKRCS